MSPNAAAFFVSVVVSAFVFTATALNKRQFIGALIVASAAAVTLGRDAVYLLSGDRIESFGAVALAPGLLGAAALYGAEWVGLPEWIAVRTGIGLRDSRARFYEQLRVPWRQVNDEMAAARTNAHGRSHHLREASSITGRISELNAPDPEWSELRDDVVRCVRDWIELAHERRNPEQLPARPHEYPVLIARFQELAHQITAERGLTMEEYAARNKRAQRLVLVTAVVVAIPGLVASWSPGLADNQWLWLELCALYVCVLAMLAIGRASVAWLARRLL